jgi:hypothetical protein
VKKGTASILVGDDDPAVLLYHFAVGVVHAVKAYGQYGQLTKRYETACKVVNHGLVHNWLVVPHKKLGGQRLRLLTQEMLQNWVENLCDNFVSDDTIRYFQGDGDAPPEITVDGTDGGVPSHAFTDGTVLMADHLHKFCLYTIKAQKQAGLHLTSDETRAKEVQQTSLLNNINRVTLGKRIIFAIHLD